MFGGPELSEKLPDDIYQLVESVQNFIREQKGYKDQKFLPTSILEVGRATEEFTLGLQRVVMDKDLNAQLIQQIKDDTTSNLLNNTLSTRLSRNQNTSNDLLGSTPRVGGQLANTTLGHRSILHQQQPFYLTGDPSYTTGQHNQFANTLSAQYFAELADQFETRMKAYGEQIEELKMSLDSVTRTHNVDELFKWLKKQHEILGEIAAKVYMTHERIMDTRIMEKKSELEKSIFN